MKLDMKVSEEPRGAGTRLEGLVGRGVECGLYPKDTGSPERCPAGEQPSDLYFRALTPTVMRG